VEEADHSACFVSPSKDRCKHGSDDCPNKGKRRHSYIGAPEAFLLDQQMYIVNKAFGEHCSYLVGSATKTLDYRDVDVRMIMDDDKYEALFGEEPGQMWLFWGLICSSISEYVSSRTGLKVDFQIQSRTHANRPSNDSVRNPVGLVYEEFKGVQKPKWLTTGEDSNED
jgi:hypothetical protein